MKKWLILLLIALFSSQTMAGQPKLRGPSRSLSSRPSISSMADRGKPRVRIRTDIRNRGSLYRRSGSCFIETVHTKEVHRHYRTPQPTIVIIQQPKSNTQVVRTSGHVTIFAKSSPNSRRFDATHSGPIIFYQKPWIKKNP